MVSGHTSWVGERGRRIGRASSAEDPVRTKASDIYVIRPASRYEFPDLI